MLRELQRLWAEGSAGQVSGRTAPPNGVEQYRRTHLLVLKAASTIRSDGLSPRCNSHTNGRDVVAQLRRRGDRHARCSTSSGEEFCYDPAKQICFVSQRRFRRTSPPRFLGVSDEEVLRVLHRNRDID